jgi:hypothetical protein
MERQAQIVVPEKEMAGRALALANAVESAPVRWSVYGWKPLDENGLCVGIALRFISSSSS